jgi:hypothetical protein|tara:strand:+ start:119 stop:298 length:180 start_codon:yes stop_codon:yes gene_type:complete
MKRLKRFQFGITPSGKKFVIDTSKDMEDQNFMKSDLLNPADLPGNWGTAADLSDERILH